MRRKRTVSKVLAWALTMAMTLSLLAPFAAFNVKAASVDCPAHTSVWAPNLVGAEATPSGRNYVTNADGATVGLFLSSSRTPPAGLQILDGGVLRHETGGGGERLNIAIKGTSSNGSEQAGFAPVDGKTYRLTFNAENEHRTGPATTIGFRLNGETAVAVANPVKGTFFSYQFMHDAESATEGDTGHGLVAIGIVVDGGAGTVVHFSNFNIIEVTDAECICVGPCPVHVGERVWAPNLAGAEAAPSGRNYVTSAAGETLGFILSSSRTPPAGLQVLDGGVLRHQSGGGGERLSIVVKGTSSNNSEQAGFAPVDGKSYRLTFNAENAHRSGPSTTIGISQFGQAIVPAGTLKPVGGTRFEYVFGYCAEAALTYGDGGHGRVAIGIIAGPDSGSVVHYSNIAIYEVDPGGVCTCEHGVREWYVYPESANIEFIGTEGNSGSGHVMRLSNLGFDENDIPTRGALLEFNLRVAYDTGRRLLAWTDLSGGAAELGDITFATTENILAGKVVVSGLAGTDTLINLTLPQELIYDEATGTFATEVYVAIGINKGETGDPDAADNYNLVPGQRGGSARGSLGLAREFDILSVVRLNVLEEIFFNTNISLNPGVNETAMGFSWWTPIGEAAASVLQIVGINELDGGAMPANAREIRGGRPTPLHPTSDQPGYQYDVNKVMVTGLVPGTEYAYRVGDGTAANWSPVYTLRTFDPSNAFRVILVGDPQLNPSADRLLNNWRDTLQRAVARTNAAGGASFMISTGDQTGGGANDPFAITNYLDPAQLRSLPVIATVGNHDTQSQRTGAHLEPGFSVFSSVYNWPNHNWLGGNPTHTNDFLRGGGNWFFSYGDALFISLNSNISDIEEHRATMESAVASHPNAVWRIVTFHHDIFGNGTGHSMGMGARRATWSAFLDEYNIDVVLNGHDHTHTRSFFMEGNQIQRYQMPTVLDVNERDILNTPAGTFVSPSGIVYLTFGAAADVPKYTSHVPWQPWVAYSDPAAHDPLTQYSVMTIDGGTLRIESFVIDGTTERLHDGITLRKNATQADLESVIAGMEKVEKNGITDATWAAFQAAIAGAKTATNPHTAFVALYDAYYALNPGTDKAALGVLVNEVTNVLATASEGQWEGQYPIGSMAVLQAVLDDAFVTYDLRLSVQADINAALAALRAAYAQFLSLVSDVPCPWVFVHDIPADRPYTIGLVDWMLEDDPWYIEPNLGAALGGKQHFFAHFTKGPYSHNSPYTDGGTLAQRTEVLFAPANLPGGRGVNPVHITQTRIGEWIRYELNVAQAGAYRATLGAVNATANEQIVVIRDMQLNVLTQFVIPANNPLPAGGWDEALLVRGTEEFYLPAGNVIIELFFVNDGIGATANSETPGNNYNPGPDVDILILERIGNMDAPVRAIEPNTWPLPPAFTRIGGDASHRQRAWLTDGNECPVSGLIGHGFPVHIYNRIVGLVMEVAGRPGGPNGNHTTQVHIMNDGGGAWLPEYNPPVGVLWDPDIGPFGALVWDLVTMPMADGTSHAATVHFPTFAQTTEMGWINTAYYNNGWEEFNYMRAYLLLAECPVCGPNCEYTIPEWWVQAGQPGGGRPPTASLTTGTVYVVQYGDTLARIAQRFYGDATLWPRIFEANRSILTNPNRIYAGQTLRIP
ncbi:MAG: metallophosphoesterase [Defluviitaleaceae bacterium]|nr:metallophosphoesterase [Defluviitaleaceae bacterium]